MHRDMTIAEARAAGLYDTFPVHCPCPVCVWANGVCGTKNTVTNNPWVGRPVRHLRAGDWVKSPFPVVVLDRCALGRVVEVRPRGRTQDVVVKWEDEGQPRLHTAPGHMTAMIRDGEAKTPFHGAELVERAASEPPCGMAAFDVAEKTS